MNNIKQLIILVLTLTIAISCGQQKFEPQISKSGNELAKAVMSGDYEKITKMTYPKIISIMGGKELMTVTIKSGMEQMKNQGVEFSSITIGKPQEIYQAGNELHCLVPQKIVMKTTEGKVTNNSFLLAVSTNNGDSWYFVDTAQMTNENATQIFPAFNQELKIPAKTAPILEQN